LGACLSYVSLVVLLDLFVIVTCFGVFETDDRD
jgi:hypothetical protein